MENKMEIFKNEEFGSVRVFIFDGTPWFAAKDAAETLGYKNTKDAVNMHIDEEDRRLLLRSENATLDIPNRGITVINESGLYALILSSKLPTARKFKHWVTSEVIPSVRKHGAYMTDSMLDQVMQRPEIVLLMAETMLKERMKSDVMGMELSNARPKADYFDAFIHPEDCTNIRATAKELQVPERWFCRFLQQAGFMYRCPAGTLMPYNKPKNDGLFRVKDYIRNGHKGAYTLITPKGKDFLRQLICRCDEPAV